jgi:hypothetical protein
MNGYNIYLMIELAKCKEMMPNNLEYDLAWSRGIELHNEFSQSKYNDEFKPEYECILEFLSNKSNKGISTATLKSQLLELTKHVYKHSFGGSCYKEKLDRIASICSTLKRRDKYTF